MKRLQITKVNIFVTSLTILSFLLLGWTAYSLMNVKVLEDWKLTYNQKEIHVGDTVTLESSYNKVRDASGESIRYITCKNSNNVWIRYELNRATSDREKGRGGTGIILVVRRDIADTPTTCRFEIAIKYKGVLPFKDINVYNKTREFKVLPERTTPVTSSKDSSTESSIAIQSNQIPIIVDSLASSSYSDNTQPQSTTQSEYLQPTLTVEEPSTVAMNTSNTSTSQPTPAPMKPNCLISIWFINLFC